MNDNLGKQLTELQLGDSVAVTIEGDQYIGEVVDMNRRKCDLVAGFMEDGYIGVYLKLTSETIDKQDLSAQHLVIGSTENVPYDFEPPTASVYNMTKEESITKLGELDSIN